MKKIKTALVITLHFLLFTFHSSAQNIGINSTGAIPNSSALLDIDASPTNNKGLLIPRLTTAERNAITAPIPESLLIYNTTTQCYEGYNASTNTWVAFGCIGCTPAAQPSVITGTTPVLQGATGVAYSVTNVVGVSYTWSYSGTGFSCVSGCTTNAITANFSSSATSGTLTVTPINACGAGAPQTFAITVTPPTFPCGGTVIPIVDVTSPTGKVWMDRNLGASQVATSSTDAAAYGDLYQWGRCSDGHEKRTSGTTATLSSSNTPGNGLFIITSSTPYDWRSPQNNGLWQGIGSVNNPCPTGYHIPTSAELDAERLTWSSNNAAGAYASPLKLTTAGNRFITNGTLNGVGSNGYYWSSTVNGTSANFLFFLSSNAYISNFYRAYGFSVRCIKD